MALLAARTQGGAGTGATGTDSAPSAVGDASSQLQGADPGLALQEMKEIKGRLLKHFTAFAFRAPKASSALMPALKALDATIKALQEAASTAEAVGGPVGLSAIPRPAPPGAIGASPAQPAPQGM